MAKHMFLEHAVDYPEVRCVPVQAGRKTRPRYVIPCCLFYRQFEFHDHSRLKTWADKTSNQRREAVEISGLVPREGLYPLLNSFTVETAGNPAKMTVLFRM